MMELAMELTIAHSEKTDELHLSCLSDGTEFNPLENPELQDDIGVNIIRSFTENITFNWADHQNKLELLIKLVDQTFKFTSKSNY